MRWLFAVLDGATKGLFWLACLLAGGIFLVVSYEVLARNLALPSIVWGVNSVEYALLHLTFLSMPYLVLTRGHVSVELLVHTLPPAPRRALELFLHGLAAAICLYLAWRAGLALERAIQRGSFEVRSFDMPRWAILFSMPLGLGLSGLQFLAFPLRGESFFAVTPDKGAGL